ncbi:hypothetical protein EYF80_066707 [Liparis tanakae]|uniref:Uncharacterized protein n=1 Tax=Liparis tanakae TaxID=230148 RepID=A0A4Z2E321_9TELE|nr:hypothetical protein EYF80_066707 [Liparis tanakae]
MKPGGVHTEASLWRRLSPRRRPVSGPLFQNTGTQAALRGAHVHRQGHASLKYNRPGQRGLRLCGLELYTEDRLLHRRDVMGDVTLNVSFRLDHRGLMRTITDGTSL